MRTTRWHFVLAASVTLAMAVAKATPHDDAERWQAMARADLDAAHALIREAHPGVIDSSNPGFNAWVEDGYQQAKSLIPHVVSYDTALAAVRYYASGFEDGHLVYSDNVREGYPVLVSGWHVIQEGSQFVVGVALTDWPTPLPPVGATWTGCDGLSADEVLQRRIAPYMNWHSDARSQELRADHLWMQTPTAINLRECSFRTPSGEALQLPVTYRPIDEETFFEALGRFRRSGKPATNDFELKDGLLWVRAGNFSLQEGTTDLDELEAMLAGLSKVSDVRAIVFDTRGNGGGDSSVGDRIFEAATGGLKLDQTNIDALPRYYAQWRVSDHLIQFLDWAIERSSLTYGADSPRVAEDAAFRDQVRAAKDAGQSWVEQDAGRTLTREDVIARGGQLRRFEVPVALLTDSGCASACLDFADIVMQVPSAIHVGQTTSADSIYMVGSHAVMPSGNLFVMPVKVWRNRARGNNEPYIPKVMIDLGPDESIIRSEVRRALGMD